MNINIRLYSIITHRIIISLFILFFKLIQCWTLEALQFGSYFSFKKPTYFLFCVTKWCSRLISSFYIFPVSTTGSTTYLRNPGGFFFFFPTCSLETKIWLLGVLMTTWVSLLLGPLVGTGLLTHTFTHITCLSVYQLSIFLSIYLSIHPSTHPSII